MKKLWINLLFFIISACGVKGKPLPPLEPVPLGRGEPSYSSATQDIQIKKKKAKKIQGDWDEPEDFVEGQNK